MDQYGAHTDRIGGLIARAKGIILSPDAEWQVIDTEPATVKSLYTGYILILAAIPPLCQFVHGVVFGNSVLGFTYHPPFFGALSGAVLHYVLTLVGIYVMALIVDALAPTFQGQKNLIQGLKLVTYSATASWLAGVFGLIPHLGILGVLGLYSFYLFYRGLPVMMKTPPDKTIPYTVVTFVVAFVVFWVIYAVADTATGGAMSMGTLSSNDGSSRGSVSLPGGGTVDLGKLQDANKALEESTKRAENGTAPATVEPDRLKKFLPDSLGSGLAREDVSSVGGQIAGYGGSSVTASYGSGDRHVTLSVTDMGAAGAFTAMAGALGASSNTETPTSYSKVSQIDGRTVSEEYNSQTRHGSYGLIGASRFMVTADGDGVSIDDLKSAVAAVDVKSLEALAK